MKCVIYHDLRCLSVDFSTVPYKASTRARDPLNHFTSFSLPLCYPKLLFWGPLKCIFLLPSLKDLTWNVESISSFPISSRGVITDNSGIKKRKTIFPLGY